VTPPDRQPSTSPIDANLLAVVWPSSQLVDHLYRGKTVSAAVDNFKQDCFKGGETLRIKGTGLASAALRVPWLPQRRSHQVQCVQERRVLQQACQRLHCSAHKAACKVTARGARHEV
jgi:hypothetical protein